MMNTYLSTLLKTRHRTSGFIAAVEEEFPELRFIAIACGDCPASQNHLSQARRLGASRTFLKLFRTEEILEAIEAELEMQPC